jgi:hypothetical protein
MILERIVIPGRGVEKRFQTPRPAKFQTASTSLDARKPKSTWKCAPTTVAPTFPIFIASYGLPAHPFTSLAVGFVSPAKTE